MALVARSPRRRRLVAAVVGLLAAASVLGLLAADLVGQRRHAAHLRASLAATGRTTAALSHELDGLDHQVTVLRTEVGNESTALQQATARLAGIRWALALTTASVTQQRSLATSLTACLDGVEQALNALAVGHRAQATAVLSGVAASCTAAAGSGA
jgi:chromosome segregation ATPase